jgi:outer membrane protein assembly factor BamA
MPTDVRFRTLFPRARPRARWPLAAIGIACLVTALPAPAQENRTDAIAAAQAEKAQHLAAPTPTRAEQIVVRLTSGFLEVPDGFYPLLDTVYSGGGFTLGAGYRHYVGDRAIWFAQGLYSIKNYKLFETGIDAPGLAGGRLGYRLNAGWRDATRVGYYGLGMDTESDDRANYRFNETFGLAEATFRPLPWSVFTGALAYDAYDTKSGQGAEYPSIEDEYTPDTAPGLGDNPTFVHLTASAGVDLRPTTGIDYRPAAGYARRGGYYGVTYHNWKDVDDTYSFDQVDVDLVQHIPILKETWVLSLHGRLQSVLNDDDTVPYFLMPFVGSGSTLRGYKSKRFRDRNSLLMQAEWRWTPNRTALDVALFFDAGEVARHPGDFTTRALATDVGIGVRFHSPSTTPLRVELAKGSEGWKVVFAGKAAF